MENIDTQIYDDFYDISMSLTGKYGDSYSDNIDSSLLNVILVLTGARTACIIDSIRFNALLLNELLEILLNYYDLSIIRLTAVEFLLFLTVNKDFVSKEYKLNMANVLGYCYTGSDFANINMTELLLNILQNLKLVVVRLSYL